MIPILFVPEHKKEPAERLVKYCFDLDGTVVKTLSWGHDRPGLCYPHAANSVFCWCLKQMDEPFFWLEADSIPLKPGWLSRLQAAFEQRGLPIMMTSDFQTPFDLCCGIGAYDPNAIRWLTTKLIGPDRGWDGYLTKERGDLISRTGLIQHSYGLYAPDGHATPWMFPEHKRIIRETSVIFHKDLKQGLIPC